MAAPPIGCAKVASDGSVTQLDGRAAATESVTEADVQDTSKLAQILTRIAGDLAALRRRFTPRHVDFEDIPVSAGGAAVTLAHNFNGRVRWWICGWQSTGTTAPILRENTATTDKNTLVLQSYTAGTACIRVEEAGG